MKITKYYSQNYNTKTRGNKSIRLIILHYTGMQSERESLKKLTNPRSKVSCHYLINRKGEIINLVKEQNIAWHAGKSKWGNYVNLNKNSIGIELVNKGHQYGYQKFTRPQINKLVKLCKKIKRKYNIKNRFILGHSDIAPLRKVDPGEKFPWIYLSSKGLGIFPEKTIIKKLPESKRISYDLFFRNLNRIGYRYLSKKFKIRITKNFQRRYRQENVNGVLDQETMKISSFLAIKSKKS